MPDLTTFAKATVVRTAWLIPFPEIQTSVHACDLVAVAVEDLRLPRREQRRQALLVALIPPHRIHIRIDVRIEPVPIGILLPPGGHRHLVDERDAHDRLDALEP